VSAPEVKYARNGDVSIAYAVGGDGPVDLLFVPGFVGNLDVALSHPVLAPFWDRLLRFARVIWFDKRGQGLSDRGIYTVEDVAADAVAVLDAVGVERASVFGVSEGGTASTMLAATYPDRVESMVLYGTYARILRGDDFPEGVPLEALEATWGLLERTWATPESLRLFAPSQADDPEFQDLWARMLRSGVTPSVLRTLGEMYVGLDVRPLLPGVRAPTLVLWREDDNLIPPVLSRVVAEGIPGARGVGLPGDEHAFFAGDTAPLLDEVEEFMTGRRPERRTERILSTVLFVDIVDSTRRATELGDAAWRDLLQRTERAWRREIEREGGRWVKSTGDGLLATFDGPSRAARAALAIGGEASLAGIQTRAGIHTGECELSGDDVAGIAVHIAARVESEAPPGGVAATSTVRDLSVGSGLRFDELGARALKGVPGEWSLFSVAG
jgi:class 3 adenylate cyclase